MLVARAGTPTGKLLVPTDFSEGSLPALAVAGAVARTTGAEVTLLHVLKPPSTALPSALMPLGDTWMPPSKSAFAELEKLGIRTLEGFAQQYGFSRFEQHDGDPADIILQRARELDTEMIVMGSRGRRGLARLVLGSVAEKVIRLSDTSVLIARG